MFDGASVEDVTRMLKFAELPESGQTNFMMVELVKNLIEIVTVGIIYMLKFIIWLMIKSTLDLLGRIAW